jgi:hypothetical protein
VRAIEDLQSQVRDDVSRRYLAEAVRAYQAGALRPAIVATWVAAALDLVAKVRSLKEIGDGAARAYIHELEDAIAAGDTERLVRIERGLLTACRDRFEILDARDVVELDRLRSDRHVCAHPAFVSAEAIFEPSPELVRSHIATAVDAVLSKGSTPGKHAINRFIAEVDSNAFPQEVPALADYLRDQFFERGKAALRRGLAELIVKVALDPPGGDLRRGSRCGASVHALDLIEPELLREALVGVIRKKEEGPGLSDRELLRFAGTLGDMDLAWSTLPESSHPRVRAAIATATLTDLVDHGVLTRKLPEECQVVADRRREELDLTSLLEVVRRYPGLSYVEAALLALDESQSFRQAEQNMRDLILPLSGSLTAADVHRVIRTFIENSQIHYAGAMPDLMSEFFMRTRHLYLSCMTQWGDVKSAIASFDKHGSHYSYPRLIRLIDDEVPF